MYRPSSLFVLLCVLAAAPLASAQEGPIREVHTVTVYPLGESIVFQVEGQPSADKINLLAGGTLVVQALDSLSVIAFVDNDGLTDATDGVNATLASPGFSIRALHARGVREPDSPSGSTYHTLILLACRQEDDASGECETWRRVVPIFSSEGERSAELEIHDGATRVYVAPAPPTGGRVRPDDD